MANMKILAVSDGRPKIDTPYMTQEELILKYAELKKENARLRDGIEKVKAEIDNSRTISLTHNTALDDCLNIINKYLGE